MTDQPFDTIMASLDPPMVIVTTAVGTERSGCLVGFHSQSSIDPARCAVWLSKANHTYPLMLRCTHFAVHALASTDRALADRFGTMSGDDVDKFAGHPVRSGPHETPLLMECANVIVARRIGMLDDGGDHVCITGEPTFVVCGGPFSPLRASAVADLSAGHDPGERRDHG